MWYNIKILINGIIIVTWHYHCYMVVNILEHLLFSSHVHALHLEWYLCLEQFLCNRRVENSPSIHCLSWPPNSMYKQSIKNFYQQTKSWNDTTMTMLLQVDFSPHTGQKSRWCTRPTAKSEIVVKLEKCNGTNQ